MMKNVTRLLCLGLIACEEANLDQKPNGDQIDRTVDSSEETSQHHSDAVSVDDNVAHPEVEGTQTGPDLICASSGFYDQQGLKTLRMELFQQDEQILVLVNKEDIHPTSDSEVESANYRLDGVIGSEFFNLLLDSETQLSGPDFQTNFSLGMELQGVNEQLFYIGTFNQFGCGPYNNASVTCWQPEIEAEFTYNPNQGVCLNNQQEVGYNPWTLEMVRETNDGQCVILNNFELNEGDYNATDLNWDLRGSDLQYSWIVSSNLRNVHLEGAQLEALYIGDGEVSGTIDDFTTLPEGCEDNKDTLYCKM